MLSNEQIREHWNNYSPTKGIESFARAIEAEVRKQDTELILQMRLALTDLVEQYNTDEGCRNLLAYKTAIKAITAARKRLENK